ncbi:unnamed protein product [Clavelina lepadiformis]|uniref:Uncharacterized protein n=1 Tax=Clavelina lepadiformis TaxID=159417 RepID=A0ABP0FDR2_CLALP
MAITPLRKNIRVHPITFLVYIKNRYLSKNLGIFLSSTCILQILPDAQSSVTGCDAMRIQEK